MTIDEGQKVKNIDAAISRYLKYIVLIIDMYNLKKM